MGALTLLLACGPPRGPTHLVVVAHDSTRFDHTSLAGYERDTTPHLAALARLPGAVTYTRAWSPASFSLPSYASLFTGRHAHEHQVGFGDNELPDDATTLAEALAANGFQTAGFTGGAHLKRVTALNQGFDLWHDEGELAPIAGQVDQALEWLDTRDDERPFFLFVHGYDAHRPYRSTRASADRFDPDYEGPVDRQRVLAPRNLARLAGGTVWLEHSGMNPPAVSGDAPAWQDTYVRHTPDEPHIALSERDLEHIVAHYDAAVAHADAQLGRLIDGLRARELLDTTAVVVLSDHGEALGEQGYFRNDPEAGDRLFHVPLVVRLPGSDAARSVHSMVSLTGLVASVTGWFDVVAPADARGRSFAAQEAQPAPALATSSCCFAVRTAERLALGVHLRTTPTAWSLYDDGEGLAPPVQGSATLATMRDTARWPESMKEVEHLFVADPELREVLQDAGYWTTGEP